MHTNPTYYLSKYTIVLPLKSIFTIINCYKVFKNQKAVILKKKIKNSFESNWFWQTRQKFQIPFTICSTGKSLSEALIFASTKPQYDDRLFVEFKDWITSSIHENSKLTPGENMLCTENVFDIQNNFCTQHVLPMFCKKKSFWQRFTCM